MLDYHPLLLELPPNRVRRNYRGGRGLDLLEGNPEPLDGDRPEDWLGSLTSALNPGCEPIPDEGFSHVLIDGQELLLRDVIAQAPQHYLGESHYRIYGLETRFLAKLIDSAVRLPLQAHPTRDFAQRELGRPWGKFECYVILSVRSGIDPYFYLGFQHPPTPEEWLRIVTEQDMPAMMACFEKVRIRPGEVWYVPGGFPHALGEGLTLLEVLEPSDLCVRCEFERKGVAVPEDARFMGLEPSSALRVFNYERWSLDAVQEHFRVAPTLLKSSNGLKEYSLIGPEQIDCFEVRALRVDSSAYYEMDGRFSLAIVTEGEGRISAGGDTLHLGFGDRCLVTAAADRVLLEQVGNRPLRLILCMPGKAPRSIRLSKKHEAALLAQDRGAIPGLEAGRQQ